MKQFTEDELDQKYNAYFPSKINTFNDLLRVARIDRSELSIDKCRSEEDIKIPDISTKLQKFFPKKEIKEDALKVMLVDLSTYYIKDGDNREYNVVEPPLGLMACKLYKQSFTSIRTNRF